MSQYTTEVRYICENLSGLKESAEYSRISEVIALARPKNFNFDYPIFDTAYKSVLETKIIKHYYLREIAHESVGIWRLRLDATMNENMPYFNQLYKSELIEFNPLYDTDLTKDHKRDNSGDYSTDDDFSGTHTNAATEWNRYSDTPQSGIDFDKIAGEQYLTDIRNINDNSTDREENSRGIEHEYTDTESYLEHVKGKSPGESFSKLLNEYRDTFLNIDMQVINSLSDLFFNLW